VAGGDIALTGIENQLTNCCSCLSYYRYTKPRRDNCYWAGM
jgi:hypothetical protein